MIPISSCCCTPCTSHDVPVQRGRLDGRRRHRLARPRGSRAAGEPRLRGGRRRVGRAGRARPAPAAPSRRSPASTSSASTRPGRSPTARSPSRRSCRSPVPDEPDVHALLGAFAASLGGRNPTADALHAPPRGRGAEPSGSRCRSRRAGSGAGSPSTTATSSSWGARGADRAAGADPALAHAAIGQRARSSACACCCSARARGLARARGRRASRACPRSRRSRCVALSERMRPDAATTVAYLHRSGVDVKIISGDGPATVAAVARAAGIETEGRVTTGRRAPRRDVGRCARARSTTRVFARVAARAQAPARRGAAGAAAGASGWSATASTTCLRSRSATSPWRSARAASSRRAWPTWCS